MQKMNLNKEEGCAGEKLGATWRKQVQWDLDHAHTHTQLKQEGSKFS